MGQDKKINIGRFINLMQWFEPVCNKSPTGFVDKTWKPSGQFFADIISDEIVEEKTEHENSHRQKLTMIAWRNDITTDWKVEYKGLSYCVKSIKILEHGRYAEYLITMDIKGNGSTSR